MRIACLGGGPGGLAFAIRAKRSDPSREIEVYDRNPAGATYGFGLVLSDRTVAREAVSWRARLEEGLRYRATAQ